jgi:hypothetical protein
MFTGVRAMKKVLRLKFFLIAIYIVSGCSQAPEGSTIVIDKNSSQTSSTTTSSTSTSSGSNSSTSSTTSGGITTSSSSTTSSSGDSTPQESLSFSSTVEDPLTVEIEESQTLYFSINNPSGAEVVIESGSGVTASTPKSSINSSTYALYSFVITGVSAGTSQLRVYVEGKKYSVYDTIEVIVPEPEVVTEPTLLISGKEAGSTVELPYSGGEKSLMLYLTDPPSLPSYDIVIDEVNGDLLELESSKLTPITYGNTRYYYMKLSPIKNGIETLNIYLEYDDTVKVSYKMEVTGVIEQTTPSTSSGTTTSSSSGVSSSTSTTGGTGTTSSSTTSSGSTTSTSSSGLSSSTTTSSSSGGGEVELKTPKLSFESSLQEPMVLQEGDRERLIVILDNPPADSSILSYSEKSGTVVTVEDFRKTVSGETRNSYEASILGVKNGSDVISFYLEDNKSIDINLTVAVTELSLFETISESCNFPVTTVTYLLSKSGTAVDSGVQSFSLLPKSDDIYIFYTADKNFSSIDSGGVYYLNQIASIRYSKELQLTTFYLTYLNSSGERVCKTETFPAVQQSSVESDSEEEVVIDVPQLQI